MPNASELDKYVIANVDVKDGDRVTIMTAGEIATFEQKDGTSRSRLRIAIKCAEGQTKEITLNETSRKSLMMVYGKMTEDWVGLPAKAEILKQLVGSDTKNVIYLKPIEGASKEPVKSAIEEIEIDLPETSNVPF